MIYPDHKKWADFIFKPYLYRLFKHHFHSIILLDEQPVVDEQLPVLLLPNHSSWWDGFFVYLVNEKFLHRRPYLMMLEEQLSQNRFFRHVGAYSINPASSAEMKRSLRFTLDLFQPKDAGRLICIFPQGELQAWHKRPIEFRRGIEFLLKRIPLPVQVLLLGIRIEFLNEQYPQVFFQFSPLQWVDSFGAFSVKHLAGSMNDLLNDLQQRIAEQEKGPLIFRGRRSINERMQIFSGKG